MRKDDKQQKNFKRSERIYYKESGWYFTIRDGASFGPYETKENAEKSLRSFTRLLQE